MSECLGIPPTISDDRELITLAFKGLGGRSVLRGNAETTSLQPVEKLKQFYIYNVEKIEKINQLT